MWGLPAKLFGPTVKAVCWNTDFSLRAVPAAIHSWESSCITIKIAEQIITSEFETHWELHSSGLVAHLNENLRELLHHYKKDISKELVIKFKTPSGDNTW